MLIVLEALSVLQLSAEVEERTGCFEARVVARSTPFNAILPTRVAHLRKRPDGIATSRYSLWMLCSSTR